MSKRKRSARTSSRTYTQTVTVPVPRNIDIPTRPLPYPPPRQASSWNRARRLNLRQPGAREEPRFRLARVRIAVPRRLPRPRPSVTAVTPNRISVYTRRRTRALLARENNRRRNNERKERRRRPQHGQIDSVRADRAGMLAYGAQRGYSASRMADIALVSRAFGWS